MKIKPSLLTLIAVLLSTTVLAQTPSEWHDTLIDQFAGAWKIEGNVKGHEAHHRLQAKWVLNHQFLRMHEETTADAPKTEHRYDAIWFLGYDLVSDRYVLHLMDLYGGRFSETLGYGTRQGNDIRFVFEYPDGPFHTTYSWTRETNSWRWLMEQKDKDGKWTRFADFKLTKTSAP